MRPLKRDEDWRADPGWTLVSYEPSVYPDGAPAAPPADAELAQPPIWCSVIHGTQTVATWHRIGPRLDGAAAR